MTSFQESRPKFVLNSPVLLLLRGEIGWQTMSDRCVVAGCLYAEQRNTQETLGDSWSDVTSQQSSITRSTWLGVTEAGTLKLYFGVKKWRNWKIIFGTYQNHENPVGDIDNLRILVAYLAWSVIGPSPKTLWINNLLLGTVLLHRHMNINRENPKRGLAISADVFMNDVAFTVHLKHCLLNNVLLTATESD